MDPLVMPYRVSIRPRNAKDSDFFIAEGKILVETLASAGIEFESVLASEIYRKEIEQGYGPQLQTKNWILAPTALLHEICGFRFHGGILGLCRKTKPIDWRTFLLSLKNDNAAGIVVCTAINNQDNLGVICRSAKAFGMAAVLTSAATGVADSSRCLRQSMGASVLIPVITLDDIASSLKELIALDFAVIGADSAQSSVPIDQAKAKRRFVLVLGNEADGLSPEMRQICTELVHIPMVRGHDSLNVGVAAGIFMQFFAAKNLT